MSRHGLQQKLGGQCALVITDDKNFENDLMMRWKTERHVPRLASLGSESWQDAAAAGCDLVVIGPVYAGALPHVLLTAACAPAAVAILPPTVSPRQIRMEHPRIVPVRGSEDAIDTAVSIGAQLLLRVACERQLDRTEKTANENQMYGILGRYMVESRHNFNNALTSILGIAELMQFDSLCSSDEVHQKMKTVQMMALRLHGMMQRFSSLETEMRYADQQPAQTNLLQFVPTQDTRGITR